MKIQTYQDKIHELLGYGFKNVINRENSSVWIQKLNGAIQIVEIYNDLLITQKEIKLTNSEVKLLIIELVSNLH